MESCSPSGFATDTLPPSSTVYFVIGLPVLEFFNTLYVTICESKQRM
ncbi:hypothetical protein WG8_1283 [Paenibacillus sp. Aloe-11]|nr:hypothetical protein WG8_1283 [Paenibacillus sp. Aloe-11]